MVTTREAGAPRPTAGELGNVVVVGAASGIGRACALGLSGLASRVACLDLDEDGARRVAAEIGDGQSGAIAASIDVTSEPSVERAFESVINELGTVHALLNCAGITGATALTTDQVDPADFDRVYNVNLRGAFLLSRAVLPRMAAQEYGRLVHLASISGKDGNAGMAAYSSTKAGLIGLVKVMGKEYATSGVTVNAIAPAVVQTPMVAALPAEQVEYMTSKIPMGRPGQLAEVVAMAQFALSPDCSYTTGFTFDCSGGRAVY